MCLKGIFLKWWMHNLLLFYWRLFFKLHKMYLSRKIFIYFTSFQFLFQGFFPLTLQLLHYHVSFLHIWGRKIRVVKIQADATQVNINTQWNSSSSSILAYPYWESHLTFKGNPVSRNVWNLHIWLSQQHHHFTDTISSNDKVIYFNKIGL